MAATPGNLCGPCRRRPPAYAALLAPWSYEPPLDAVVRALKYRRLPWLGERLALPLADAVAHRVHADLVVAVPLHWRRRLARGYNQAEAVARPLARRLGLPWAAALARERATPAQAGLDRAQRRTNVRGAFRVARGAGPVAGLRILLVDDVATTGATLHEAARCLRAAGATSVTAVAVARTPAPRRPVAGGPGGSPGRIDSDGKCPYTRHLQGKTMGFPGRSLLLTIAVLGVFCAIAGTAAAGPAAIGPTPATEDTGVAGKVLTASRPLTLARVYLYRLGEEGFERAITDEAGDFRFGDLPAGLYKVIVHKPGFLPAVVRLTRITAETPQFLELELVAEPAAEAPGRDDFWSVRAQIPPDVLRDIQVAAIADQARRAGDVTALAAPGLPAGRLLAEMNAMTGVDSGAGGSEGQVTRGGVGIEGRVGRVRLGLEGDYWQMQPMVAGGEVAGGYPSGEASAVSLEVAADDDMRVRLTSRSNRLLETGTRAQPLPVDFEQHRLSVSHSVGDRGRSDFSAAYTAESNFYRQGWFAPLGVPDQSRSWRLEGVYTSELDERSSLQAGLRYRQRTSGFDVTGGALGLDPALEQRQVDVFGRAGTQVASSVLVEYGLYTTMRDGSLSLSPRGGLVVQLAPSWQAEALASYEAYHEGPEGYAEFTSTMLAPGTSEESCEDNEQTCFRLAVTRQDDEGQVFSVAASHRQFDEVQRLDFSEDLADRNESLYIVPGDEVPELEVAVSRRLSPRVLARLESSFASGGGGVFYATDSSSYENRVRYLVTSLDTHFDGTATGLFVAFHHLEQQLESLEEEGERRSSPVARQLEVERLELMLTQDLNILLGVATDMAVQLNMQLSRGTWPFAEEDDGALRRRLMGGIALRF